MATAALTDKFLYVGNEGTLTSLQSPGKALAASSITIGSGSNWPSASGFIMAIRTVDSSGVEVANTYTEWLATYPGSGTTVTINPVPVSGSDQVYTAGTNTQVFIPISAKRDNLMVDGLLAQHTQTGAHTGITTDTLTATGTVTAANFVQSGGASSNGWNVGLPAPNTVVYNGNRSYSMVFNGTDQTGVLSPGMRIRTTRTVAAPTQCTTLNGTTQYYSKVSPAGMTFTNGFVVSAYVKLTSYSGFKTIISRYNGTSGFEFSVNSSGQVYIAGYNGAGANNKTVVSYQSLPLNKWVHVAAQLDMATFTNTATTCYIMFDGADVPCSLTSAGTNPTAIVQAGNLEIGSQNGGTSLFPGKIAQAAIFSAKVTQATIQGYISQGLVGTETSLISAYSFNNTINDLNATNANNLTANGSAVATTADSPFGGQAGGAISSTLDYGIVQAATFSTNTTVVVQVPEGCTIPTTGGVSAVVYSSNASPYGFPKQEVKWTIDVINKTQAAQLSAVAGTWYNLGSTYVNAPIGEWVLSYWVEAQQGGTSGAADVYSTLSTTSSTETDSSSTSGTTSTNANIAGWFNRTVYASLPVATPYYLNTKCAFALASNTLYNRGEVSPTIVRAKNAYL